MSETRTILVVDDDHELRESLQTLLQRQGYQTLAAGDGLEAKKLIDRSRPDLVILDLMMPRLGGFPVLQHFNGIEEAPPFIMITANEQEQCKTAAEKAGVVDYIRKPFTLRRLLEGINRALAESSRQTTLTPEDSASRSFIRCRCPSCGAQIRSAIHYIGQTHNCPGCRQPMLVRVQPPDDEGPKLAVDDDR